MIKEHPPIWKDWNKDMTIQFVRSKKEIYAIRRWHWGEDRNDEPHVSPWFSRMPPFEIITEVVCREDYKVYKLPC